MSSIKLYLIFGGAVFILLAVIIILLKIVFYLRNGKKEAEVKLQKEKEFNNETAKIRQETAETQESYTFGSNTDKFNNSLNFLHNNTKNRSES